MRRTLLVAMLASPAAALAACSLTSTDGLSGGSPPASADAGRDAAGGITPQGGASTADGGTLPADAAAADAGKGNAASAAYRAAVLADAPVAYYRFEDVSAAACADEVAGSRYSCATSATGLTHGAPGIASSASVRLDGVQGTVSIAASTFDFSKPYSLEFWIDVDAPANGMAILQAMETQPRSGLVAFLFTAGEFRTELWNADDFATYTLATTALTGQTWHHVVIGHDPTTSFDFSYVDGVKSTGGNPYIDAGDPTITVPFVFAGFAGRLDEIALYDRPLSAARILAHYGLY